MNFGSVVVRALVVLALLFFLSLAGAISFPALTQISNGTGAGLTGVLLFLITMLLLSIVGNLIARGVRSVKKSGEALLLAFVGAFFMGAILTIFDLLHIPYTARINLTWLGVSWYSPIIALFLIGSPLMLVFLVGNES